MRVPIILVIASVCCSCAKHVFQSERVIKAVEMGDLTYLQDAFRAGTSVDLQDQDGDTLLMISYFSRRPTIASWLLSNGASPNIRGTQGYTYLHLAAKDDNIAAISEVLPKVTDLNAKTKQGYTALHFAAAKGHERSTKLLVSAGCAVNAKNSMGETPLIRACMRQVACPGVVRVLLEGGADLSIRDITGRRAREWAQIRRIRYPKVTD